MARRKRSDSDESAAPGRDGVRPPVEVDLDEDTLRIMVSTDNHLGYCERDPVRGLDSFAAFEEVLYLAKMHKCDMVLIAGDLFHDNKPSRSTMHRTMEIIRRYCMGPDAVQIQIVSDQSTNFRSLHGTVNYEDQYYSVDLPIFSIHGNHDDPTRDAGAEMLAALDLLAVSNLVNYFGRQDEIDKVQVSPILMHKGDTKLALYGLGSMRDERLNRMWTGKHVSFLQPDQGDWFHIFCLHQNRDLGRGVKNCVHESMIPDWMDLVVWGHEHECLIEPAESVLGTFRITQPGSSVATSLTTGEAVRKHVGVLDVKYNQFRMRTIPLTQVRSFVMGEISLQGQDDLDPDDPKIDAKVTNVLGEEVRLLIHEAKEKHTEVLEAAKVMGNYAQEEASVVYKLEKPEEVLVRLKVEHTGFTTLNNQRFGARYVGKVANPDDILLFHRRKEPASRTKSASSKSAFGNPVPPEEIEEIVVEDLLQENLGEAKLQVFNERGLGSALEEYVDKQQTKAIPDALDSMLKKQIKKLVTRVDNEEDEEEGDQEATTLPDATKSRAAASLGGQTSKASRKRTMADMSEDDIEEVEEESEPNRARSRTTAATISSGRAKGSNRRARADESSDDEMEDVPPTKDKSTSRPGARPKRQTAQSRVDYSVDRDSDDGASEESEAMVVQDDDDDDDSIEEGRPSRTVPRATANGKKNKPPPRTSKHQSKKKRKAITYASDSDDDSEGYGVGDNWGSARTNTEI